MIRLNYPSLLQSQNLRALLRVIREGESSQDDTLAFRMRYGGAGQAPKYFESFDAHPRIFERTPTGELSSAAGAFQHTWTTWSTVCMEKYGLGPHFTPYEQECAAVALIHHRGALDAIIEGNFVQAVVLCSKEWASLPGSPLRDGGGKMTWDRVRAVYAKYGGSELLTQPPAPIEERDVTKEEPSMGPLAFLIPLIQSLATIFTPVLQSKLTSALDKQVKDPAISATMATQIIDIVKQAATTAGIVPATSLTAPPIVPAQTTVTAEQIVETAQVVAAVKANPVVAAQVEAQVSDYFDRLAPVLDKLDQMEHAAWQASETSANAAAERYAARPQDSWDMTKTLVWGMLVMMGFLLLFVAGIAGWQTYVNDAPSTEVWAAVTGLIGFATGIAVTVFAFRFGYSRQSGAKDALLSELATRRAG